MSRPRVLFWVQHLLGIGHLRRALTLSRALSADGFDVTLASGGMPVPDTDPGPVAFVQLPPVRAVDVYFKVLVDQTETVIDDAWRQTRAAAFHRLYDRIEPDVLMTELFPFGRRQFRFEMVPLLERLRGAARPPLVVASVRDILVAPPKVERMQEMLKLARSFYDLVLVHGDPALVGFAETFPHMAEVADRLRYTGYVVEPGAPESPDGDGVGEVIVSAGGGAVSEPLLRAALAARTRSVLRENTWRFLVGHNLPEAVMRELQGAADPGVVVERARPDFAALLRRCRLSVSQGGYNTVMEVLDAGARAVIVPYAGGLETEQTLRAERLAARGALQVVAEAELGADSIAAAIGRAMAMPPPASAGIDMGGARTTAELLRSAMVAPRR